jgi:uncharacterized protein YceH (UPF0502 family)
MVLRREEARVLACLIDKSAQDSPGYPVTLNALRLACNQTTDRWPVVTYDDRTVESALVSLRSMGLVRFVEAPEGGREVRYRHSADDRWRLSPSELAVLSVLVLRGPQTADEVCALAPVDQDAAKVDDILDMLAARSPEPFAARLDPRPGEQQTRFAHLLTGEVEDGGDPPAWSASSGPGSPESAELAQLADEVAALRARVQRLEGLLGVPSDAPHVGGG